MKKKGDLLRGLAILLVFLVIGEWLSASLKLILPGSMVGLVLLFIALVAKIIKLEWIEEVASLFMNNLILLFIPAAVGIKLYWSELLKSGVAIVFSIFLSTLVVLFVTAKSIELFRKPDNSEGDQNGN